MLNKYIGVFLMILLNFDDVEHQCEGELVNIDPFQCQKKRNSNVGR